MVEKKDSKRSPLNFLALDDLLRNGIMIILVHDLLVEAHEL